MARYFLLKEKTKPQRVRQEKQKVTLLRGKHPKSDNDYQSIVEFFGEISSRNRHIIGHIAIGLSSLLRIGRTKTMQIEDGEALEVNRYDVTILQTIKSIIPIKVLQEKDCTDTVVENENK